MATGSYGIANVKDITSNFNITLSPQSALCPTYSMITENPNLCVSGATYAANQLVLYKHIYKKVYKLTISNLNDFLSAMGYEDENGYWELCPAGNRYNGGSYPISYLQYNGNNYIQGTQAQWTAFFNVVDDKDHWDTLDLLNSETNDIFSLNEYYETSVITVFTNLKNGSNQTILLSVPSTPSATSAVIDLNNEWITGTTNPSPSKYYSFESRQSKGVDNSGDYIYLKIKGYTTYTLYIRSDGENYADYVMVSKPDASITYLTRYDDTNVYAHTKTSANSGTTLSAYTEVTFTGLTTEEHTITIVYKKDDQDSQGSDAGYVLIPKGTNVSYKNEYLPSATYAKDIVFGLYEKDVVTEIDMTVTVTITSNNGQTYTQSCRITGGNGANHFSSGCTIQIQYTGTTPNNITYKYEITNNSTTSDCYFNFAEYYDSARHYDKRGCYVIGNSIKESDGTPYVATEIPILPGFFAASDARLELYFYHK